MERNQVAELISSCFPLIPYSLGLISFKSVNWYGRLVIFFLFYGFVADISYYATDDKRMLNLIYSTYALSEILFYTYFFAGLFKELIVRNIAYALTIGIVVFWFYQNYHFIFLKSEFESTIFDFSTSIYLIGFSSFSIIKMMEQVEDFYLEPIFWISFAVLFYFFCGIFLFQIVSAEDSKYLWIVQDFSNIIANIIFTISFALVYKRETFEMQKLKIKYLA